MNCSEAQELFGDAIDGAIATNKRDSFFEHLQACFGCRRTYELESMAKAIVKAECPRVATPPDTYQSIKVALERASQKPQTLLDWAQEVFTVRRLVPALAASLALAAFLILYNPRSESPLLESDAHTASNDVIFQSLQNFARLEKGEFLPVRTASKVEDVHRYLDSTGMKFGVVHSMDCCKSYGVATSEYDGIRVVHLVYTLDGDVMYVYQVRKAHVLEGSRLIIPPAARTALEKTGWYTDPHHPDCNVVLWISNETLCAAVSSMKKDEMLAMLNQN